MSETIEDSVGTRQREAQRRRSRIYGPSRAGTVQPDVPAEQSDSMRAEPYAVRESNRDELLDGSVIAPQPAQRGQHGAGAGTTGNSVRGALSGGLSGATTTRGDQQGGIGASVHDPDSGVGNPVVEDDPDMADERDLTLGEQYGGVMQSPDAMV